MKIISADPVKVIGAVVACSAALFACQFVRRDLQTERPAGKIRFDSDEYTAPPILASEVDEKAMFSEHTFLLLNGTQRAQRLRYIGADCSCVSVRFDDGSELLPLTTAWVLEPGDSRPITVRATLRPNVMASAVAARFESEDARGSHSELACKMRVSVVNDVVLSHPMLTQEIASVQGSAEATLVVTAATRGTPAAPVRVDNLPREVAVLAVRRNDSADCERDGIWLSTWAVRLAINWDEHTEADGSPRIARLSIATGKGKTTEASFPIILRRTSGLEVASLIHFGTLTPGVPKTRRLIVHARDEKPFHITQVKTPSCITAQFGPAEGSTICWVELTLAQPGTGRFEDAIRIMTDNEANSEFSVKVFASCESSSRQR
jgi:hypothetical protein